jgi:hypothetical protein
MTDTLNENAPSRETTTPAKAKLSAEDIIAYLVVGLCVAAGIIAIVLMVWIGHGRIDDETSLYAENPQPKLVTLAWHERAAVSAEQEALVELASVCDPAGSGPKATAAVSAGDSLDIDLPNPAATASPQSRGYLMAATYLSQAIGRARVEAATAVAYSDQSRQVLNWAIVLIGAGSTVLISLKSMASKETKPSVSYMLSVLAIVASALATSASGLNAFYTPNVEYEKSQRLLTSLQHLHSNLVIGMTRKAAVVGTDGGSVICAPIKATSWDKDWRLQWLRNLSDQFRSIQVSADVGSPGAEPTDENTGSEPLRGTDKPFLPETDSQSPVDRQPTSHPGTVTRVTQE